MKIIVNLIAVFLVLVSVSCRKDRAESLLDSFDSVAIAPDLNWAVIKVPYVAMREDCRYSSPVTGHARRGDVFLVEGSSRVEVVPEETEDKKGSKNPVKYVKWYKVNRCWVDESQLMIVDTKLKAENLSNELSKKDGNPEAQTGADGK